MMKSVREKIRKHWRKLLLPMIGGGIAVVAIAIGVYTLTSYTESASFCGTLCHTPLYPQYTTNQASPHSDVPCGATATWERD